MYKQILLVDLMSSMCARQQTLESITHMPSQRKLWLRIQYSVGISNNQSQASLQQIEVTLQQ
ncbi:hypothetical protein L910_1891 [Vibrio fluvialis PG41]|uniref:Uncharacterized protein n=1 Tax=Vibrio fluvialis PG41 TaxID=1336752 RepID=S7JEJ1_VIBFL|nr:hypothetical protein L910_1891 [Vibrio fluvialis PG41]